jgi:hypothetical protein
VSCDSRSPLLAAEFKDSRLLPTILAGILFNYRHHNQRRLVPDVAVRSSGDDLGRRRGVCKSLADARVMRYGRGMAFIVLRRSRNTRSYYLVESYRDDQGKTRRRTLCYLGREQDSTDTLAKALAHWEKMTALAEKELSKAGGSHRQVFRRRIAATATRIRVITEQIELRARTEAERRKREQQAEEARHWQSFVQLRRNPTEENAKAAKRAFLFLAKRHHPDQGGTHDGFLRLKEVYDRALEAWRDIAA